MVIITGPHVVRLSDDLKDIVGDGTPPLRMHTIQMSLSCHLALLTFLFFLPSTHFHTSRSDHREHIAVLFIDGERCVTRHLLRNPRAPTESWVGLPHP